MFDAQSVDYGMKLNARCVEAILGDQERHRFLVGTASPRKDNELHLLEFMEDTNEIQCVNTFKHDEEVLDICPSPNDPALFFTCGQVSRTDTITRLWKFSQVDSEPIECVLDISDQTTSSKKVLWDPVCTDDHLITFEDSGFRLWKIGEEFTSISDPAEFSDLPKLSDGCWDPHHPSQFVSANGNDIRTWNFINKQCTNEIKDAHSDLILSIDYNPNKPYQIVSAGRDRFVKFWDLRKPNESIKILSGHTHWVWSTCYNRFHDQLVLSGSSDCEVRLWSIVSISSAPLQELDETPTMKEDCLVRCVKDHEETIYSMSWSACDAWVFATLSYDGRFAINHVPPSFKYKILLN